LYCKTCGIPLGISRGNVWHADGTISGRYPPYIKGTFFDVDEIGFLFGSLSDYMDYDIGDIVASGKYHDTKEYMTALIAKMREASGGELPPPEELYRTMLYPACIWGIADVEFSSTDLEKMTIRVKNPYSIPLLCGDVAGVAEVVMGQAHQAVWEGDRDEGLMHIFPAEAYAALSSRIDEGYLYGEESEADELACERCAECGAPAAVAGLFRWEESGCRIEERSTGRRYCFNNTRGITAVLSMLVEELGEDIEHRMVDIARDYSRALYAGGGADLDAAGRGGAGRTGGDGGAGPFEMGAELESFPYRGWGKVADVSAGGEELALSVENPYNNTLMAGRIWGMQEAASGISLGIAGRETAGKTLRLVYEPA
jgi:hypothetical protein